jgi:hypothetical protein
VSICACRVGGGLPKSFLADVVCQLAEVAEPSGLKGVVEVADELVDLAFMFDNERGEVVDVQVFGALGLWEDEPEEED